MKQTQAMMSSRRMLHVTARICSMATFISLCALLFAPQMASVKAADGVPAEYYANYQIKGQRDTMINAFEQIQAAVRVGSTPQPARFIELQSSFNALFPHFPQTPSRRVIYEQCKLTVQDLTSQYDGSKYVIFKDKCFIPLNDIIRAISTDYTVKPVVAALPNRWPAPLNVTLDARESVDAAFSNDTLPEDNFFWWYKNIDGNDVAIGQWPVVNHTFPKPGNYIVHVTVRSANAISKGIFDGEASVSVSVAPKSANIAVYVNGELASEDNITRLGTEEAQRGVVIDGTSTAPVWGRKILSYTWTVMAQNDAKFIIKRAGEGSPDQFTQDFPRNGLYKITLAVVDNEDNTVTETYQVSVSDPVATIKFTPEQGDTSSTYSFDATASYSLTSRIKKYQRILSNDEGEQMETYDTKQFKRAFKAPGQYTVKLTITDELGNESYDVQQFFVDSTTPQPSFTIRSMSDLKKPSQFILDAGGTFDEDVRNGYDEVRYTWNFSPKEWVKIDQLLENGKIAIVSFDQKWTYKAQLTAKDQFQKEAELEKNIVVDSTVRPVLEFSPQQTVMRGEDLTMNITANKPVGYAERTFGDGQVQKTTTTRVSHQYKTAGAYKVIVRVVTPSGEENEITRMVFVGQKDQPTAWYEIRSQQSNTITLLPTGACAEGWQPAYVVDRYQKIVIDATSSRGVKWTPTDQINFVFKTQEGTEQKQKTFSTNFSELWCQYVDLFVEDILVSKTDTKRIWFDVKNALPTIDYLTISFPQYNDRTAANTPPTIGLATSTSASNAQNILSTKPLDPVTVRVAVSNVRDPDGFINKYIWYYFKADAPENLLDIKYTPASVPYAVFSLPRQWGTDFEFGVRVLDSDGGEVDSRDYFGKWPIVSFPPDDNNPDVPIVSAKASITNIQVGDEVVFTTTSSILSKKQDFETTRYFKYDFDGDGIYDLTTNKDTVKHTYTKPSTDKRWYRPKVKVFYRERAGTAFTEAVFVRQRLQPKLLHSVYDNKVLFYPTMFGEIETSEICLDVRKCTTDSGYVVTDTAPFMFNYPAPGVYELRFFALDRFGNQKTERTSLTIGWGSGAVKNTTAVLSIPEARQQGNGYEITVGDALDNTISLYVAYVWSGDCYVDRDITQDGDGDGEIIYDRDTDCNELTSRSYTPTRESVTARIFYASGNAVATKDITVQFLDVNLQLSGEHKLMYEKVNILLKHIEEKSLDEISMYYKTLLISLRDGLGDKEQTNSTILQLYDVLQKNPSAVTPQDRQDLERILAELSDGSVAAALGWNEYDTAKKDILLRFKGDAKEQIQGYFGEFEKYEGTGGKEERKKSLDAIIQLAKIEQEKGNLDEVDIAAITARLCDIIVYYDLPSKSCGTIKEDAQQPTDTVATENAGEQKTVLQRILTWALWIVGVLVVAFIALILLFALKARRQKQQEWATPEWEKPAD